MGENGAFTDILFLVHRNNKSFARASSFMKADYSTLVFSRDCSMCVGDLLIEFRLFSGHASGSLVMVVPLDNVIITGDMLLADGLPTVSHSALDTWAGELAFLETFENAIFVPGHGPVSNVEAVKLQRLYLESLIHATSTMKLQGLGVDEAEEKFLLELPHVAKDICKHRENLRTAYLQVA